MKILRLKELRNLHALLQILPQLALVLRHALYYEDVDENALIVRLEAVGRAYACRVAVAELGVIAEIVDVAVARLEEIRGFKLAVAKLKHTVVIGARHAHVYIIIPRNESFVAHRSEHCATLYPAAQIILLAKLQEAAKQIGFHRPYLFHFC